MLRWSALPLLAALCLSACKKEAACRPGTLFVTLAGLATVESANRIDVGVLIGPDRLSATIDYTHGETIEIELPTDQYVPGTAVDLDFTVRHDDAELVHVEQTVPALAAGCTTVTVTIAATMPPDGGAPLDLATIDLQGADLVPAPDLATKPNGEHCAGGGDCMSGLCVDGYCCNATCDGQCEACDIPTLEGVCAPVASAQPHGARTPCAGGGACAGSCGGTVRTACSFPQPSTSCRTQTCTGGMKTKAAGCDGAGSCLPEETVTCPQGCAGDECMGACTTDGQCSAATPSMPYCDDGVCTAKKPRGRTCSDGTECTSGKCADGYCCNADCAAQCESCKEAGSEGTCLRVTGTPRSGSMPARSDCAGSGVCKGACDGSMADCQLPNGSTPCGSQSCAGGMLTAVGMCASGSCSQSTSACANGNCADGTSCGPCTDSVQCGASRYCDSGTCRPKQDNGVGCSANEQCTSGHCVTNAGGTGSVCCNVGCSGTTPRCSTSFTACICTSSSCGSGTVCNPSTLTCCACGTGCRSFASCGGACGKNCSTNCCCGAGGLSCCPSGQACQ